jgi:hypothetical protein
VSRHRCAPAALGEDLLPTQPSRPDRRRRFSEAAVRQSISNFGSGLRAGKG